MIELAAMSPNPKLSPVLMEVVDTDYGTGIVTYQITSVEMTLPKAPPD